MKLKHFVTMAGIAAVIGITMPAAMAQNDNQGGGGAGGPGGGGGGRPRFDPEQMRQRMMENLRDQMSVTNDDEWREIETRVQKVMDARRDIGGPNMGRLFRNRQDNNGGDNGGRRGRGGFFGGQPMPELEALDTAIDNKVPTAQVKAAMERYREARKQKEAALEKAQADLKGVLTTRQEAVAVSMGLVN